jgi:hypothetical protein
VVPPVAIVSIDPVIAAPDVLIVNIVFLIGAISNDDGLTVTSIVVDPVGNAVGLKLVNVIVPVL